MKIPKEETDKFESALATRYSGQTRHEVFKIEGRFEPGFIHLDVVLERRDDTWRYAMQFRCALQENGVGQAEGLDLTIDFVDWYLDQYFESNRELMLPLDFEAYNFGEFIVYGCGDIDMPHLSKMADEILERGVPCEKKSK